MKKGSFWLLIVLVIVIMSVLTQPVLAKRYVVRPGDCLWTIAQNPSVISTWYEIAWLNGVKPPWKLSPGQALQLITRQDLQDAYRWCEYRALSLDQYDENQRFFLSVKTDISRRRISYDRTRQPSYVHADTILSFARAWRKNHKGFSETEAFQQEMQELQKIFMR